MTLQQIFIANLKKNRKYRGFSQMVLSEKCDTTSNYIGQIEMGRRIPSFEKIEKIAAALEIPCHELFILETSEKKANNNMETNDYIKKMPSYIKKEIVSNITTKIKKDITAYLNRV